MTMAMNSIAELSAPSDTRAFVDALGSLLGPKGIATDAEAMAPWLTDWRGRYTGRAIALVSPASTDQVADVVALCGKHGVAIVPQGGNSGMAGGATPDKTGTAILLSLRRMNTIRSLDPQSVQAVCEAGVILQTFHEAAEEAGLRFPLTLGGKGSATIGGLVSTNAGGTQVLRHGTMRAQVLGVEAVLPNGKVFDALTALKKDNRGFDLKQLLIGSEGTLGIVTAATLRLLPAIKSRVTAWVGMDRITTAGDLLRHVDAAMGDTLEGFEVMPRKCLDNVIDHLPDARSPLQSRHSWHALIECVATTGDAATLRDKVEATLADAADNGLLDDAIIAANERQADDLWTLRDSISAAERALGPAVQHDISVPVDRMPAFIEKAIPAIEGDHDGVRAIAFGHLGDGNVHFHVIAPTGATPGAWEETEGKAISARVHDLVTQWGGSISAEHGIGQMKVDELGRLGDPVALSMMRAVKNALDPDGLLNPGKLVPSLPHGGAGS